LTCPPLQASILLPAQKYELIGVRRYEVVQMIPKIFGATLLVLTASISFAQQNSAGDHVPGSTITGAKLSEYRKEYGSSTLCGRDEIVLWTCEVKRSVYSLCSSPSITRTTGYLQYRASKPGRTNFSFPASKMPPLGHFQYSSGGSGNASISFENGMYEYDLNDPLRTQSSLTVTKKGPKSHTREIVCDNSNTTLQVNYTIKLMYDAGIWEGY
jgi:hypothetical protein